MTTIGQPERATQNRVIALFRDELGYRYLGDKTDTSNHSNIEEGLLTAYLTQNDYTPAQISSALYKLRVEADKRYLFKVEEKVSAAYVSLKHNQMVLHIRPDTRDEQKQDLLAEWYREKLKEVVPTLIAKWEPLMGVKVEKTFYQRMKTRWGSCNYRSNNIRLNTELAKKPPECLEYVVVHEMAHLLEPSHNSRFIALMDQCMPSWRNHREDLNQSPLGHVDWNY
jgi:predicted metal-dependent hydrolase